MAVLQPPALYFPEGRTIICFKSGKILQKIFQESKQHDQKDPKQSIFVFQINDYDVLHF